MIARWGLAGLGLALCLVVGLASAVRSAGSGPCQMEGQAPVPFGRFPVAPLEFANDQYEAEWFVAPSPFNMPHEVILTPAGELVVLSVRNRTLYKVGNDGTARVFVQGVDGYHGVVDKQGNIYLHCSPGGQISCVAPDGTVRIVITEAWSLRSDYAGGEGFALASDGDLYAAVSVAGDRSNLFRITPQGQLTCVARGIPNLWALCAAPDGRLLGASWDTVYEISLHNYSLTKLGRTPASDTMSLGGVAVDRSGNIYISRGARGASGRLFRIDPSGNTTLLATIPHEGLTGIEWRQATGEIVGAQLREGALVAVRPDGSSRELVAGNGLVNPGAMAFSPSGNLAVVTEEAGMAALLGPQGQACPWFHYRSFSPPIPFLAYAPDGTIYATEAAPGEVPVRVLMVRPGGSPETYALPVNPSDMPCGVVRDRDGSLIVSETGANRIVRCLANGSRVVLAAGIQFPQALVLDADGNLYAVTGIGEIPSPGLLPIAGDAIIHVSRGGQVSTVARLQAVTALAISPTGELFATANQRVVRVSLDGTTRPLCTGFTRAWGLAFDLAGMLYVSDMARCGIVRIDGFPYGTLAGVVKNQAGVPVAGARVSVVSDWPITVGQEVTTDAEGRFSLRAAPRTYTVTAQAQDGTAPAVRDIRVTSGQVLQLEIALGH